MVEGVRSLSCQCSKQWEERLLTIDIDSSGLRPELQQSGNGRSRMGLHPV